MTDSPIREESTHGSASLDREHDIIAKAMTGLHNAVLEGRGPDVIVPLVNLLARFCAEHFANEEGVMRDCGYSGAEAHAAAHERLLRTIMELQSRSAEDSLPTIVDTMDLLGALSHHVDTFDYEAHRAIREAAERPLLMAWHERYQTGIIPIDIQHHILMDLTNRLHTAATSAGNSADVSQAMEELLEYTIFHFTYEERLMAKSGYPALEEHRRSHDALLEQLNAIQKDIAEQRLRLDARVMNFLQGWLTNHIVSGDRHYVPFAKAHAAERSATPIPVS